MTERVSVVIPAHGHERLLPTALSSVVAQNDPDVEVLVVEHQASETAEALARGDAGVPLRSLLSGGNTPGAARNAGVAAASGSLLAFLDADDLWPPGRLADGRTALDADPELDAVFGRVRTFNDHEERPIEDPAEALRLAGPPQATRIVTTALFRRQILGKVGRFDDGVVLGSEIEWVARAEDAGLRYRLVEEVVLLRRSHAGNTTRVQREDYGEYARSLKQVIDRRRGRD